MSRWVHLRWQVPGTHFQDVPLKGFDGGDAKHSRPSSAIKQLSGLHRIKSTEQTVKDAQMPGREGNASAQQSVSHSMTLLPTLWG